MKFKDYVEIRETLEGMGVARESFDMKIVRESGLARSLGGGVLAGALALGGLASAADHPSGSPKSEPPAVERDARAMEKKMAREALEKGAKVPPSVSQDRIRMRGGEKDMTSSPRYKSMVHMMKDEGRWYDPDTVKKLQDAAEAGDEWAVRELRWPAGHKFHKKGRPYFRNDEPHPKGLFLHSGLRP